MKPSFWYLAVALFAVAFGLGTAGFFLPVGYAQGLLGNAATTFMGLAAVIMLVNHYLTSSEKGAAATPLAKLIAPAVQELHNDLFVSHLKNTFGIEKMRNLVGTYQKNKRNPKAFSPDQCNELHEAIMCKAEELLRVYDLLID